MTVDPIATFSEPTHPGWTPELSAAIEWAATEIELADECGGGAPGQVASKLRIFVAAAERSGVSGSSVVCDQPNVDPPYGCTDPARWAWAFCSRYPERPSFDTVTRWFHHAMEAAGRQPASDVPAANGGSAGELMSHHSAQVPVSRAATTPEGAVQPNPGPGTSHRNAEPALSRRVESLPAWVCHDGRGNRFRLIEPERTHDGRPLDEHLPLARLAPVTDSAGNPLPADAPDSLGLDELGDQIRDAAGEEGGA